MSSTGIAVKTILDVTKNTLHKFKKQSWVDMSLDLTEFVFFTRFLSNGSYTEMLEGGDEIQWQVQYRNLGNAQSIGAFSQTDLSDRNIAADAKCDWRVTNTHMIIDKLMKKANKGPEQLVDMVLQKKHAAWNDAAVEIENRGWGTPSESDDLTPFGIPTWVVMYDSTDSTPTAGGFLGTNPYDGTAEWTGTPDGLSAATYGERVNNYAAKYAAASMDDLVKKMRAAADKTFFKAPNSYNALVKDTGNEADLEVYMPYDEWIAYTDLAQSQDSDIKTGDVTEYDGKAKFRGRLVTWVPQLDSATGNPVYMINWKSLKICIDSTMNGVQDGPDKVGPDQHTTIATNWDWRWQTKCEERRRNAVLSTTAKDGS